MARAIVLCGFGGIAAALAEVIKARRDIPLDGRYLPSDEAAALAEGWEFQAADDLYRGHLTEGLEDLAIAEQILQGRPEHREHRGRICAQLAAQLSASTPDLRSVKAEYLATARELLKGSDKYRELLASLDYTLRALRGAAAGRGAGNAGRSVGIVDGGRVDGEPAAFGELLKVGVTARPAAKAGLHRASGAVRGRHYRSRRQVRGRLRHRARRCGPGPPGRVHRVARARPSEAAAALMTEVLATVLCRADGSQPPWVSP
jgi:hypothetical protein